MNAAVLLGMLRLLFQTSSAIRKVSSSKHNRAGRIGGGKFASILDFPFVVRVVTDLNNCGGTIISARVILTACHCITEPIDTGKQHIPQLLSPKQVGVIAGTSDLKKRPKTRQEKAAERLKIHPQCEYDEKGGFYRKDIGYLILASELELSAAVQPLRLFSRHVQDASHELERLTHKGKRCQVLGWGLVAPSPKAQRDSRLQVYTPRLISDQQCRAHWCSKYNVQCDEGFSDIICAVHQSSSACMGYSGGPLVCNGYLLGVTSWTHRACEPGHPSAFADLTFFDNNME